MYKTYEVKHLEKLEELSTADLKAIYDYAEIMKHNYECSGGVDVDIDEVEELIEYWDDIKDSANILLEARIKQIFKP